MATLTSQAKNTATLTNIAISNVQNMTWNAATQSWDTIQGTWDSPGIVITNQSKNTSTLTNQARS